MGLANVLYEWDNWASQCTQGMGLVNLPCELDYLMGPGNGTSQSAVGMRLSNVPWEWD